MMKQRRAVRGETLPETLVALLIVSLTFLFLTGAVVTAAKINARLKNEETVFHTAKAAGGADDDKTDAESFSVSAEERDGMGHIVSASAVIGVRLYQTGNGYYYYE